MVSETVNTDIRKDEAGSVGRMLNRSITLFITHTYSLPERNTDFLQEKSDFPHSKSDIFQISPHCCHHNSVTQQIHTTGNLQDFFA